MRTDTIIDRKLVKCPNASTLGYGKWKAQFGDIVLWKDSEGIHIGRVAGRIQYAPALGSETPAIRNHLLIVALSRNHTFPMERWVDPQEVIEVYDPANFESQPLRLLTFLFGPEFKKESVEDLRKWIRDGAATPEDMRIRK